MKLTKAYILLFLYFLPIQKAICQNRLTNKEIARFYFEEVVNKQRLDLLGQVFADSFRVHILVDSTEKQGTIANQTSFLKYLFKAFPDIRYDIGDIIEEGDKVAMRVSLSASHKNEFWGHLPAGNRVKYLSEIFFFRLKSGKVVESWVQVDLYNLFRQLKGEK
jgi:predicted ester cyclase